MGVAMRIRRVSGIAAVALTTVLGFGAALSSAKPAEAGVFIGFGFGFPVGFSGFYYPPYPYLYYPPPGYYPALGYYPPPAGYQPSSVYGPPGDYVPSAPAATPQITYTPRPGWTNAQGQYCREYKSTQGADSRATERYGTACRDASGQWRIAN
jgi:hypothetical protein